MNNQAAQTMPEPITASMCPSSDYAKGWNDCLAAMLAAAPSAPAEGGDAWSEEVAAILEGYGFAHEAAIVFASAELKEYRDGECDCAELAPRDIADLLMDVGTSAVEKWKAESVGRPYGYKTAPEPLAQGGVDLEQFRDVVNHYLSYYRGSLRLAEDSLSPITCGANDLFQRRIDKATHLLALIDANPPQPSASVGATARELLAAEYRAHSFARLNAIGDRIADPNSALTADEGCALRAIEQALTQQRGECVYLIRSEFGGWTEQSKAAHEWWDGRETAPERRILYTTHQPSADAVREDSARLDWIESQIREYGDGYTEPREAGWGIQWQQERPDHYWPGLRAWIDEERRRASGDELESLLSAASGEKGVG